MTDSRADVARAYAPYVIIIAIFSIANITSVKDALTKAPWYYEFQWPGLDVRSPSGEPLSSMTFAFGWLPAAGTLLLIAGVLTTLVLRVAPAVAVKTYGGTLVQLGRRS